MKAILVNTLILNTVIENAIEMLNVQLNRELVIVHKISVMVAFLLIHHCHHKLVVFLHLATQTVVHFLSEFDH